ncbi:MAG: J domain-containing protein [Flavobacteriales bacterium]|nr:J domain-containing protein [Flavobacteriales bacterium]
MSKPLQYDHYKVLGITRDATPQEVKRAYRERAKACHPDVNGSGSAARVFHAVNEAYTVLSDDVLRAAYDAQLAHHRPSGPGSGGHPRDHRTKYRTAHDPEEDELPATRLQRWAFIGLHVTGLLFGIATVGTVLIGITFMHWPYYMLFFTAPGALAIPESLQGLRR